MPTLTVYRHGSTMGSGNPNATPPQRTEVLGWSAHAVRRNVRFLYSVDETVLEELPGVAFTLTLRECPLEPKAWQRARDAFLVALRRKGVVLVHWVTEWQRRGVPHLHLAAYWPAIYHPPVSAVIGDWLRITAPYGSKASGQHHSPIYDALGWNQYVSKHAARGLSHYQRSPENIPEGWRGQSTGRMWGKLGSWPILAPDRFDLGSEAFHRFRRIVRSWRLADSRRLEPVPRGCVVSDGRVWQARSKSGDCFSTSSNQPSGRAAARS